MRRGREERSELTGGIEGVWRGHESAELEMAVRRIHATRVLVQGELRERNPRRGNGLVFSTFRKVRPAKPAPAHSARLLSSSQSTRARHLPPTTRSSLPENNQGFVSADLLKFDGAIFSPAIFQTYFPRPIPPPRALSVSMDVP